MTTSSIDTADLSGRVVLVTGASGGIGQALSQRLLAGGARLAAHYSSSARPVEHLADAATARGQVVLPVRADLSDIQAASSLIAEVNERLGPVEILVVNHGRGTRRQDYRDVTPDEWDVTFAINTRAPFLLAQAALPSMQAARFGRILFTSSVAAQTGGIVGPDYAASKAALHGLVHYLARRVAGDGITVNALAPALIEQTGMLPGDPSELAARLPVGRLGRPDEVANIALAILTNGYLTDQVISVNGGMHPGN